MACNGLYPPLLGIILNEKLFGVETEVRPFLCPAADQHALILRIVPGGQINSALFKFARNFSV